MGEQYREKLPQSQNSINININIKAKQLAAVSRVVIIMTLVTAKIKMLLCILTILILELYVRAFDVYYRRFHDYENKANVSLSVYSPIDQVILQSVAQTVIQFVHDQNHLGLV